MELAFNDRGVPTDRTIGIVTCSGELYVLLCADDGMVGSRGPDWLQVALNMCIRLLRRYRLLVNVSKSKAMTFQLSPLLSSMSEEAVEWRCTGRGETYCERLRRRIPFPDCGV